MYTALTGKFPFGNGGPMQTLQRKHMCQFVPLRLLLPGAGPGRRSTGQPLPGCRPRRRPSDCDEFLDVLGGFFPESRPSAETVIDEAAPVIQTAAQERRASLRYSVDMSATFVPFHESTRHAGRRPFSMSLRSVCVCKRRVQWPSIPWCMSRSVIRPCPNWRWFGGCSLWPVKRVPSAVHSCVRCRIRCSRNCSDHRSNEGLLTARLFLAPPPCRAQPRRYNCCTSLPLAA